MNRLFKTTMIVGLLLSAHGAFAEDDSDPAPRATRVINHRADIQADGGKIEFQGNVRLQERAAAEAPRPGLPVAINAGGGAGPMRAVEFHPDGRGNMIFTATAPLHTERGAFLGLTTTRVPAVLREQLKLKAGLVVEAVEPNSPADVAGLKTLDVVEKLDEQWLINSAQLAGLVRMQKPGDVVTLSILHKGERQTLKAKLAEREMPVADDDSPSVLPGLPALPNGVWHYTVGDPIAPPAVSLWQTEASGPSTMARVVKLMGAGDTNSQNGDAAYEDKSIMLKLNRNDGHTVLTATDKAGKKIFEGPIDTPQDREKLPQEVRQKMERLERVRAQAESAEGTRAREMELEEREVAVRRLQVDIAALKNEVEQRRKEAEAANARSHAAQPDSK